MGQVINGQWYNRPSDGGQWPTEPIRPPAQFKNWIGTHDFPAQSGRYHLYVSYACPWSHCTILFRQLKNLSQQISMSLLHPKILSRGWEFIPTHPLFHDPLNYARSLYEIYLLADPFYTGPVFLPVLWDKQTHKIVNNDWSDITRMLNSAFNSLTGNTEDFYPTSLHSEIDAKNTFIYENINVGVYQCGLATKQASYDQAFDKLFAALNILEKELEKNTYLIANKLTETDWRLFITLIRFDCVYYSLFKCNLKQIADYKNLSRWLIQLYNIPGIAQTINFEHIKQHYYNLVNINPSLIIPKGPLLKL